MIRDEKAKYLFLDSTEIHKQLYKIRRQSGFNDWFNIYIPDKMIDAREIFRKNNIPEEFQKIIVKINIPFCLKKEAEEYTTGFPFDITAGQIEKENNQKVITVSNCPIFEDNQIFIDKIKFRTKISYSNFEDVINFLLKIDEKGYLKSYLQIIKDFFDISINLDLLFQSWNESQEKTKKALKIYKKKFR